MTGWPGTLAAGLVGAVVLGALGAVWLRAGGVLGLGPGDWAALRFTLWQAFLSALFSVALAVPLARALARQRFPGRRWIITLLGAPFILPVIVAVLGLLAVFGRAGLINQGLTLLGLPAISIYGLHGVVLAHVFFNLPLATRLIVQGWQEIPAERFRLAAQLNLGPGAIWRVLEWPMLARVLPGVAVVVFTICLSSFAVVLTLGGGPRATTIELAIYQAFRFDFDLARAASLGMIQIAITGVAATLALALSRGAGFGTGHDRALRRWDAQSGWIRRMDRAVIALAVVFLLLPLAMVVARGLPGITTLPGSIVKAALMSIGVALGSVLVTLALALPMALSASRQKWAWVELAGFLGLAVSPLVIGTGLFLILFPLADPARFALPLTALVNAILALPFVLRILVPAARETEAGYGRLMSSLAIPPLARLRLVVLPRLRPQLGFGAGLTAALSMGDLGVIALFAAPDQATLPLQMYRLMGAYRMQEAAGAALLLLALSLLAFWLFDRGGRGHAEA